MHRDAMDNTLVQAATRQRGNNPSKQPLEVSCSLPTGKTLLHFFCVQKKKVDSEFEILTEHVNVELQR
jgi:hypothetical protein